MAELSLANELLEIRDCALRNALPGKQFEGPRASLATEAGRLLQISERRSKRRHECVDRAVRYEPTGLAIHDDFGHRPFLRADARKTCQHRLDEHDAERLVSRRHAEYRRAPKQPVERLPLFG